jgi:single-stranded DNA-binding protein
VSYHKVILNGFICNTPKITKTKEDKDFCFLIVATTESCLVNGERSIKQMRHKVLVFREVAKMVAAYAKPGSPVFIEGKIQPAKKPELLESEGISYEICSTYIDIDLLKAWNEQKEAV